MEGQLGSKGPWSFVSQFGHENESFADGSFFFLQSFAICPVDPQKAHMDSLLGQFFV